MPSLSISRAGIARFSQGTQGGWVKPLRDAPKSASRPLKRQARGDRNPRFPGGPGFALVGEPSEARTGISPVSGFWSRPVTRSKLLSEADAVHLLSLAHS